MSFGMAFVKENTVACFSLSQAFLSFSDICTLIMYFMKKGVSFRFLAPILFFVFAFSGLNAQPANLYSDAVVYNDFIVEEQAKIGEAIMEFTNSFSDEDLSEARVRQTYQELLDIIAATVTKIEELKGFGGSTKLRDASLQLFLFYDRIVKNQYKELLELMLKPAFEAADEDRYRELVDSITSEEAGYDEKFAEAQGEFAEKYNIQLVTEEDE